MRELGLYIHVPFCKQKCNYCDFYSRTCNGTAEIDAYVNALCEQIEREAPRYKNCTVKTIFIGGGTPSLLSSEAFERLCASVYKSINIDPCVEFSLEANPGTLTLEKLKSYRKNGVNRLSIGLQSVNEHELKLLGRIHSLSEFEQSLALVREAGFDNINVDIMYGLPSQNLDDLQKTVDHVCKLAPTHISAYSLKIEEGTPFYKQRDSFVLPSDEAELEMYLFICSELKKHGYEQYEISNFSKAGKRCSHNLTYWKSKEYIGFGPSAHSFFDGKRYFYPQSTSEYISCVKENSLLPEYEEQTEILQDSMDEFVMLALRLSDGISLGEFKAKYGKDLYEAYPKIRHFLGDFLVEENESVHFTEKGFFVSNYILSQILF